MSEHLCTCVVLYKYHAVHDCAPELEAGRTLWSQEMACLDQPRPLDLCSDHAEATGVWVVLLEGNGWKEPAEPGLGFRWERQVAPLLLREGTLSLSPSVLSDGLWLTGAWRG